MLKNLVLLALAFVIGGCNSREQEKVMYPDNVSEEQREKDIQYAFEVWNERYLKQIDEDQYYVAYDDNDSTVSEAHGYGMLILVMTEGQYGIETKKHFDGMYHYAKSHPSDRNRSFMAWKQTRQSDGTMMDDKNGSHTGSATDGDMDIAFSLLLADQLWGSDGDIDYKQEAITIIYALMETVVNHDEWTLKLGDWVRDEDPKYGKATRTSDWMIGHMATFYEVTGDERWLQVLDKTIELTASIQNKFSPETGLLPDFVRKQEDEWIPVEQNFLERENDAYYAYNACRVPWRLASGYYVTNNIEVKQQIEKINAWVIEMTNGDPSMIKSGYDLAGNALVSYTDMAFVAPFIMSGSINADNQEWVNLLWEKMTKQLGPDEASNYYSDTIRLLVMLFMGEAENPSINVTNI
ncbi:glycosyl hydrolase family 8 [Jeotgalibaca sp. A122]|uniref:glycosyl hydrolase family 8 n=1 Tax=Jeotgalibaca sp. A122 TaxID=3457322 RepID=UPI003FD398E4